MRSVGRNNWSVKRWAYLAQAWSLLANNYFVVTVSGWNWHTGISCCCFESSGIVKWIRTTFSVVLESNNSSCNLKMMLHNSSKIDCMDESKITFDCLHGYFTRPSDCRNFYYRKPFTLLALYCHTKIVYSNS